MGVGYCICIFDISLEIIVGLHACIRVINTDWLEERGNRRKRAMLNGMVSSSRDMCQGHVEKPKLVHFIICQELAMNGG